jgi:hypothetical protein
MQVKIGYSRNPWARLSELRGDDKSWLILATEHGGVDLESQRHAQFASLRIVNETFKYGPELQEFVATLRSNTTVTPVVSASASASVSVSASEKGSPEGKQKDPKNVIPPSRQDVEARAKSMGFSGWESWFDHFEANGWKVGKAKATMKDWHAAMNNGKRLQRTFDTGQPVKQAKNYAN